MSKPVASRQLSIMIGLYQGSKSPFLVCKNNKCADKIHQNRNTMVHFFADNILVDKNRASMKDVGVNEDIL